MISSIKTYPALEGIVMIKIQTRQIVKENIKWSSSHGTLRQMSIFISRKEKCSPSTRCKEEFKG